MDTWQSHASENTGDVDNACDEKITTKMALGKVYTSLTPWIDIAQIILGNSLHPYKTHFPDY